MLAEERAPALKLRQRMQDALERREFDTVLQLLHASEGIGSGGSSAGGSEAAEGPPPPAASWHPYDRAALYDCALWACAQRADPDEARHLVDRMWREQVWWAGMADRWPRLVSAAPRLFARAAGFHGALSHAPRLCMRSAVTVR